MASCGCAPVSLAHFDVPGHPGCFCSHATLTSPPIAELLTLQCSHAHKLVSSHRTPWPLPSNTLPVSTTERCLLPAMTRHPALPAVTLCALLPCQTVHLECCTTLPLQPSTRGLPVQAAENTTTQQCLFADHSYTPSCEGYNCYDAGQHVAAWPPYTENTYLKHTLWVFGLPAQHSSAGASVC
jgi:hypothetical protein